MEIKAGITLGVPSPPKKVQSLLDAELSSEFRLALVQKLAEVEDLVFNEVDKFEERVKVSAFHQATGRTSAGGTTVNEHWAEGQNDDPMRQISMETGDYMNLWPDSPLPQSRQTSPWGFFPSPDSPLPEVKVVENEKEEKTVPQDDEGDQDNDHYSTESVPQVDNSQTVKRTTRYDEVLATIRANGRDVKGERAPLWQRCWSEPEARMGVLDGFSGVLILLNAFVIGVGGDLHPEWGGWVAIDGIFACLFSLEILIKIRVRGIRRIFCGHDRRWSWFEAVMAALSMVEFVLEVIQLTESGLWYMRVLRLLRICRLLRVARLQLFADLMIMVKGSVGGMKTLFWATILICLPLYCFAIGFRLTLGPHFKKGWGAEYFMDIQTSFFTLFRCIVSKECTDQLGRPIFSLVSTHHGWGYSFVYCFVDLLMSFGLFNVIVAIFIENVLAKAKTNEQMLKRARLLDSQFFAEKMVCLVGEIISASKRRSRSVDNVNLLRQIPGGISEELLAEAAEIDMTPDLWELVRVRPQFVEILRDLDVADEDSMNLFRTLDADGSGTIDVAELFDGISKLRGSATRSDIIAIDFMLQKVADDLRENGASTASTLDRHESMLQGLKYMMRKEFATAQSKDAERRRRKLRGPTVVMADTRSQAAATRSSTSFAPSSRSPGSSPRPGSPTSSMSPVPDSYGDKAQSPDMSAPLADIEPLEQPLPSQALRLPSIAAPSTAARSTAASEADAAQAAEL